MTKTLLYIAIDFGTTYSGYCLRSHTLPKFRDVEWGSEYGIRSCKTPTCILFDSNKEFKCFGYTATKEYMYNTSMKEQVFFFSNFKMDLYKNKNVQSDFELTAVNGEKMSAITVFAEALRFFKNHALHQLKNCIEVIQLKESDVTWVLTVPAIWSNSAKQFMRNAAIQAGLLSESEPDRLVLALEPEAASVYCKGLPRVSFVGGEAECLPLEQQPGKKYIVADCGGGTIDITVHEVLDGGKLKEVYKTSGNDLGGQTVDREFKSFLQTIIGDDCWKEYERKYASELQKLMYEFASAKCGEENRSISVQSPYNLPGFVKKQTRKKLDKLLQGTGVTWNEGSIVISPEKLRSFFDASLTGIAKILKEIMRKPELHIDYLLLVGGYASSNILQNYLRAQFDATCKVLCPLNPQVAIMDGAVDFGMKPELIVSRICALTYGTDVTIAFDASKHKAEKKYVTLDGQVRCMDRFERLVMSGESVLFNETRSYTYIPVSSGQAVMKFRFFSTEKPNAEYIDESGVDEIGTMSVPMPDPHGGVKRKVQLMISFGFTEITAKAIDLTSKSTKTITINFMRK